MIKIIRCIIVTVIETIKQTNATLKLSDKAQISKETAKELRKLEG